MCKRLDGKVAVVTGGARGIGRAIAEYCAKEGAKVAVVDLDEGQVRAAAEEIAKACGTEAIGVKCDVTDGEAVAAAVKTVVEKFEKIDILVNNAGITKDGLMLRMSEEDWDVVQKVNMKGAFLFSKAMFKPMKKAGGGRIINIASVVGQMGNVGQANYAASKAGLIGFTKALAQEWSSRNILVNAIAPGFVRTPMTDVLSDEAKDAMLSRTALRRMAEPKEIAGVVVFLASEDASYITGEVVKVNGGLYF